MKTLKPIYEFLSSTNRKKTEGIKYIWIILLNETLGVSLILPFLSLLTDRDLIIAHASTKNPCVLDVS